MLKDRLMSKRKEKNLSREKLAELAGISTSTITFLENGRNKSSRYIVEISNALGVSAEWLKEGVDDKETDTNSCNISEITGNTPRDDSALSYDDGVEIPHLKDTHASFSNDCFQFEDYTERKLRFSQRTLENRGVSLTEALCVTVIGDSMEPVIPDGCVVAVDMGNKTIKDGDIYAINNDGLLQIKVLKWITGSQIAIESYNKSYDTVCRNIDEISVVGRVFWYSVLL